MVNQKQNKRQRDIKTKLVAAICMLLVSSIMMVSTTYAWFTLSTAPEVTGITTAVGANGNLEMALLPKDGLTSSITSGAGDGIKDIEEKNVTWGNLVDLSDNNIYGLDKITLYPSALNLTDAGNVDVKGYMLKTPTYGADGRVSGLVPNAVTGYFDNASTKTFIPNDYYGVRAVGTASGMTERQLSYRNARSAANTARAMAANLASQSLNNNGSSLANIAIEYGMGTDTAEFDQTDVASLRKIIDDLQGEGGILDQIEKAYLQYILAYAASQATGNEDTVWSAVKGAVEAETATLTSVTTTLTNNSVTLPTDLTDAIAKYQGTVAKVTQADTDLKVLENKGADATFTWDEIKTPMLPLANPAAMKINGFLASEVKEKLGDLVSSVTEQGGLKVIMETGAGVYADIADQSGDYTASVTIEQVEYNGITLNNMKARMETDSSLTTPYLVTIGNAVENAGAPAGGSGATTLPISDMYGYVIDMAFRTNAAESNLLLQVDAVDRIYNNNTNEDTMGGGSSMTFKATTTDFSDDQVKDLMKAIKIVFFNPEDGTIYCYAGLDTAHATLSTDGWTAQMYLYTSGTASTTTYKAATYAADSDLTYYTKTTEDKYTAVDDATAAAATAGTLYTQNADGATYDAATYAADSGLTYYTKTTEDKYTAVDNATAAAATAGTLYTATTSTGTTETVKSDNVIMPLTQNNAAKLSVLVYLDGENMGNEDVATATTSMTGSMNLQFASSATLVPMDYTQLHPGADND